MTALTTPSFLSNPLYYKQNYAASLKQQVMQAEIDKSGTILSNEKGTPFFADTLDPGAYILTDLKLQAYVVEQPLCEEFITRFQSQTTQLEEILEIARKAKTAMMQMTTNDSAANYEGFIGTVHACLSNLTENLNQDDTFSGISEARYCVTPLDNLSPASPTDPVSLYYYLGGKPNMPLTIHDSQIDKFPITAADPFIANLVHSLRLCLSYAPNEESRDTLNAAQVMCDTAAQNDYQSAKQKVVVQAVNAKRLSVLIPQNLITQKAKQTQLNHQDKYLALEQMLTLQSTLETSRSLLAQQSVLSKQFLDVMARL